MRELIRDGMALEIRTQRLVLDGQPKSGVDSSRAEMAKKKKQTINNVFEDDGNADKWLIRMAQLIN